MKLVIGTDFGNGELLSENDIVLINKHEVALDGRGLGDAVYEAVKTSFFDEKVKPLIADLVKADGENNGETYEVAINGLLKLLAEIKAELKANPGSIHGTAKYNALIENFVVAKNEYYGVRVNNAWHMADKFGFFNLKSEGYSRAEMLFDADSILY